MQRDPPPIVAVHNVQPSTRKERQAHLHREDLEKMRLRNRREGYCDYQEVGVTPPPDSLSYITEAERFVTDTAAVEKREREVAILKREQMINCRRALRADSEEKRWRTIELEHQMDKQREERMRRDGQHLRYSDEALKYRGALRADNLQRRMNSGYNPITGEPTQRVVLPERPEPPQFPRS